MIISTIRLFPKCNNGFGLLTTSVLISSDIFLSSLAELTSLVPYPAASIIAFILNPPYTYIIKT
jgi:hypothetical protein